MITFVVRRVMFLLLCLALLCAWTGCQSTDYKQSSYYRRTIEELNTSRQVAHTAVVPSRLSAGVARVDITPPIGTPLQGFGARRGEPSRGVHDPLFARVLVLRNQKTQIVFVNCDLMGVTENLYDAVLRKAKKKIPLSRRSLVMFATHTHSGAGGLSDRFAMELVGGHFRPHLFEATTDKIAAAIVDAASHVRPARIAFARGEVDGVNRNRARSDAPVDRELKVMRVSGDDGKPMAWLVNFAAHPTVFGANWEFTADYPGYLARELEHNGAVCLFANGAAGDLNIQGRREHSHEAKAERAGQTLAEKALSLAADMRGQDAAIIDERRVEVTLPPVRIRVGKKPDDDLPSWLGAWFFPRRVPLQLIRIDHELFLTAPVEFCAAIGLDLKQAASTLGYDLFIVGYANDYIGYVVPEARYESGDYEARTSFYGPKLDSYLKDVIAKMMEDLPR